MKAEYPNMPLIEYKFREQISDILILKKRGSKFWRPRVICDSFLQSWPNTGGGFAERGFVYGQAFTDQYTTVVYVEDIDVYGVFFGNELGYLVKNPNYLFFDDVKNRTVENVGNCDVYGKTYREKGGGTD